MGPPLLRVHHLTRADFREGLVLHRWGFVGASLLAPALVSVLLLLLAAAEVPLDSARRWIGTALLAGYLPFATIAYTSQYTFLPGLAERDVDTAALWYLHDAASLTYALDLTGDALLGMAAIVLASTLTGRRMRLTSIALALVAMGVLSLVALAFHAAGFRTATSIATVSSAVCTLPVMLLAIAEGRHLRRATHGDSGCQPAR